MIKKTLISGWIYAAFALTSTSANAENIKIDAVTQGWWATETGDGPGIGNHLTGFVNINIPQNEYRSFYVFDTSAITYYVKSATFRVRRGTQNDSLMLGFWDVKTPADVLRYGNSADDGVVAMIHADLGTGKSYGKFSIANGESSDYLELTLNNQALKDLRKSSGNFIIGASVLGYKPDSNYSERSIFGYSGTHSTSLILDVTPVPEPTSIALFGVAMTGLALSRRRKV